MYEEANYLNGELHGETKTWYEKSGEKESIIKYEHGKLIDHKCWLDDGTELGCEFVLDWWE